MRNFYDRWYSSKTSIHQNYIYFGFVGVELRTKYWLLRNIEKDTF
jgi:hypothetical protein